MRRIGILTAGGDTPALNATIYGAVERANALGIQAFGLMNGFDGMLHPRVPTVHLNPLFTTIPDLQPYVGGTILGSSRTYIDPHQTDVVEQVRRRLESIKLDGLLCIGGDGTISGMQPLAEIFPCVLAPKTIDNDLGLNYLDEPNEWIREPDAKTGKLKYRKLPGRDEIQLEDMINYVTPGYATAVLVVAQSIERIRTTAESHRRIAIVEVMGRLSGYIALGSAYGQPDIILIPEAPLNFARLEQRVRELYELQKHVVVAVGEGVVDETGNRLGETSKSVDPAGNINLSGAAEHVQHELARRLGDEFFSRGGGPESAARAIFTRKVGHTQRGGRPIAFDRFYATQLGGKAVELLVQNENNSIATLQWSHAKGFYLDSISANKLRDQWRQIRPRLAHASFYDAERFQPSKLGIEYLKSIFTNAVGQDDVEEIRCLLFNPGKLATRYQSLTIDIHKRVRYSDEIV